MALSGDQASSGQPRCPARLPVGSEAEAKAGGYTLPTEELGASEEGAEIRDGSDHPDASSGVSNEGQWQGRYPSCSSPQI